MMFRSGFIIIILLAWLRNHNAYSENKVNIEDFVIREIQNLKLELAATKKEIAEGKQKYDQLFLQYKELRKVIKLPTSPKEDGQQVVQNLKVISRNKRLDPPKTSSILTTQVAFYADLSNTLYKLGSLHTIVYDNVKTNIGNGYNKNDGIFTAPVPGVYVFSWYGMAESSHLEELDLVVNGQYFTKSYSAPSDFESASKTVVMDLNQGDEVWIRTSQANGHGIIHGAHYNSFTGWLLYLRV